MIQSGGGGGAGIFANIILGIDGLWMTKISIYDKITNNKKT